MDTYSFISENGTVRQIEDLIAKAKDEEQDTRLTALEQAMGKESYEFGEKLTGKTWLDGKPIYRYGGYRATVDAGSYEVLLTDAVKSSMVNSIVAVGGSCVYSGNLFLPLTGYVYSQYRTSIIVSSAGIVFQASDRVYTKLYYFVEYTKA